MRLLTDNEIMAIADAEYVNVDLDAIEVTAEVDAEMVMAGALEYIMPVDMDGNYNSNSRVRRVYTVQEDYTPFRDYEYGF